MIRPAILITAFFVSFQFLNAQDSLHTKKVSPWSTYKNDNSRDIRDKQFYLTKSKSSITAGSVLIGVGLGCIIGGFSGIYHNYDLFTGEGSGYVILWIAGVASLSTGIPLLVKGLIFKHKANLILKTENLHSYHIPLHSSIILTGIAISL